MSLSVKKYSVADGDTIQSIAQYQLGDRNLWIDIVGLNRLRSPYIGNDLPDQFGSMLGILNLQSSLVEGSTQITHWDASLAGYTSSISFLEVGSIILFSNVDEFGNKIYDAALITEVDQSVASGSGHIQLQINFVSINSYKSATRDMILNSRAGIKYSHGVGESFQVYGSPFELTTVVAQIGDTISLPVGSPNQSGNIAAISISDIVDALGVDISLDQNGQKKVGPGGDVLFVSGIENMKQALRIRVNTLVGELGLHPEYGSQLQLYVGTNQNSSWSEIAKALVHDCLIQDPRIHDVVNLTYSTVGDASYINAQVQVSEGGQLVSSIIPLVSGGV